MRIGDLFRESGVVPDRLVGDAPISGMTMDSRRAKPGRMFVVMPSRNSDANHYIAAAQANGATSVLTYSSEGFELSCRLGMSSALLAEDLYKDSLWKLAKTAFGNPTKSMKVVGVTGTNGKTTTAWLIRDMFKRLGLKAAYLGTLGFQLMGEERELQNTTPFAIELNELLAEARDAGAEALAMEVSSHALAEKRVDGVEFDAAVFTNLTQDHLDFHGSMEAYEASKLRLFRDLPAQSSKEFVGAVNTGDPAGARWATAGWAGVGYQIEYDGPSTLPPGFVGTRLYGRASSVKVDSIDMAVTSPDLAGRTTGTVHIGLGGAYNVENCLSAAAGLLAAGFSLESVKEALPTVRPVPGRFEAVRNDLGVGVLVDYAHTPDALEKLLDAVRPLTRGRIITVFGCGGDRDRTKRPKMARAASERSDLTIVTSDNPRTEDPQDILGEVLPGIAEGRQSVVILERPDAIARAVEMADPGDVVVIAGKGHENYQIIGRTKFHMDDRELAREALARRNRAGSQP